MNEELMRQNLENNRYQSSGIVDNIVTMGIANPLLENTVRNSLAKESSAAFQMALHNGGIYQNNTFFGGNGLYGLFRKVTPKSLRSGKNANYGSIGPFQFNKFSAGSIDAKVGTNLSHIAQNISDNKPNWNVEDDVVATGIGFQKKGYKEFFNQLSDEGFELVNSLDITEAKKYDKLTKKQQIYYNKFKEHLKSDKEFMDAWTKYGPNDERTKNAIKRLNKNFYASENTEFGEFFNIFEKGKIQETVDEVKKLTKEDLLEPEKIKFRKVKKSHAGDYSKTYVNDKKKRSIKISDTLQRNKRLKSFNERFLNNKEDVIQGLLDEEVAYNAFINDFGHLDKMPREWNAETLSQDIYEHLTKKFNSTTSGKIDLTDIKKAENVNDVLDDFFKLEKSFNKFGKRTTSEFHKAYAAKIKELNKKLSVKNIKEYAAKHGGKYSQAKLALEKEVKETLGEFIKDNIDDAFRNLGDDVGRHFASKTGFQKLMGNNATRFLTGVQAGMSSFLWQLPLMVVSATASINQENAIQNFVSSYLYNPKNKEMYNNEATNRSMQISQNIHYSNLQDTQNIIIKHNTAERYLNDLDPINIDLDYSQKSFDLNPRNE